jgi:hypothetical protein
MTAGRLPQPTEPEQNSAQDLLAPNYQNRLRVIGRALDEHDLEQAVIVDTGATLILRAYRPTSGANVTETFTNEGLIETLRVAIYARGDSGTGPFRSPLRPTGYEDFLRALGYRLDERNAAGLVVVECPQYFHVSGLERIGDAERTPLVPFAELYEFPRISRLINEAVARRANTEELKNTIVQYVEPDPPLRIIRTGARLP